MKKIYILLMLIGVTFSVVGCKSKAQHRAADYGRQDTSYYQNDLVEDSSYFNDDTFDGGGSNVPLITFKRNGVKLGDPNHKPDDTSQIDVFNHLNNINNSNINIGFNSTGTLTFFPSPSEKSALEKSMAALSVYIDDDNPKFAEQMIENARQVQSEFDRDFATEIASQRSSPTHGDFAWYSQNHHALLKQASALYKGRMLLYKLQDPLVSESNFKKYYKELESLVFSAEYFNPVWRKQIREESPAFTRLLNEMKAALGR